MYRRSLAALPEVAIPDGYQLREYRPGDEVSAAECLSAAFGELWTSEKVLVELAENSATWKMFVIVHGQQVVATATARATEIAGQGYVHWVGAHPDHSGKRLGYSVTLAVLHECAAQGATWAILTTDDPRLPAIQTYLNLDFEPIILDESHPERWEQILTKLGKQSMITSLLAAGLFTLTEGKPVPIWPANLPLDSKGIGRKDLGAETVKHDPREGQEPVDITGNVSNPTLTLYKPAASIDTGAAVMVCPGGGYYILASNLEGTEICQWLNRIGVTAILLKYRVPSADTDRYGPPLQDAQRGLGLIRSQAKSLGIDPKRIGIIGFSAGGHLSANLGVHSVRTYAAIDSADEVSCRPDFSMLIYPAYLNDVVPTKENPPTFILQTADDPIPVENTLSYAAALAREKVIAETHIYPVGGHGYGLRPSANPVSHWPDVAAAWMKTNGWLKR
jgi:acetyl esterase/lipase/GNAT superfamily N-acetyltransferase